MATLQSYMQGIRLGLQATDENTPGVGDVRRPVHSSTGADLPDGGWQSADDEGYWVPFVPGSLGLRPSNTVEDLETRHKTAGALYSADGSRNAQAGSISIPLFPRLANLLLSMPLGYISGGLPPYWQLEHLWCEDVLDGQTASPRTRASFSKLSSKRRRSAVSASP